MNAVPRLKPYTGPAVLSYGFRPFFLAGALYSGLAIAIWMPVYFGELTLHTAFAPLDWHIHEMLFGFLPAVIAGFLLTAIPNWTGRPPVRGNLLLMMAVVWVLGRVAVACSEEIGWRAAMLVDASFLLLAGAVAAREVLAAGNLRNMRVVALVLFSLLSDMIAVSADRYRRWPSSASIYLPNGQAPKVGDIFVQTDLANSLQYMADEERIPA